MKSSDVVLISLLSIGAVAVLFAVAAYLYIRRRRRKREDDEDGTSCAISHSPKLSTLKFSSIDDLIIWKEPICFQFILLLHLMATGIESMKIARLFQALVCNVGKFKSYANNSEPQIIDYEKQWLNNGP
ncbi:unnamed protein product [Danaus chrysippus]|uniref:(African queen) hypothetical protein n=1 Tax=Danaus chrysippus TaxID=151541 RepID=A0A8J2W5H5_9NEOP|nr:unnamed protein product [Danaus chrysippus]